MKVPKEIPLEVFTQALGDLPGKHLFSLFQELYNGRLVVAQRDILTRWSGLSGYKQRKADKVLESLGFIIMGRTCVNWFGVKTFRSYDLDIDKIKDYLGLQDES